MYARLFTYIMFYHKYNKKKGKVFPLEVQCGPEGG